MSAKTHAAQLAAGFIVGCAALVPAAAAEPVTWADLDGRVIEATIVRKQVMRRDGRTGDIDGRTRWKVVIGPGNELENTVEQWVRSPRGERTSPLRTATFTLGEPRALGTQGGGAAAWEFADRTLTFVRTYRQGAYRATFELVRGPDGITCTISETFGREEGRGAVVMESAVDGAPVTLVSTRQMSSTCRVATAEEAARSAPPEPPLPSAAPPVAPRAVPSTAKQSKPQRSRAAAPGAARGAASDLGPPGPLRGTGIGRRCRQGDAASCRIIQARCNAGFQRACAALGR